MPLIPIIPAVAIIVLGMGGLLAYLLRGWLHGRQSRTAGVDGGDDRLLAIAVEWKAAEISFAQALDAFGPLPSRLYRLADVAEHRAQIGRQALRNGASSAPPPLSGVVSYDSPVGLARATSRFPPLVEWQRFDRAFAAFTAVEVDQDRTLSHRISVLVGLAAAVPAARRRDLDRRRRGCRSISPCAGSADGLGIAAGRSSADSPQWSAAHALSGSSTGCSLAWTTVDTHCLVHAPGGPVASSG